MESGFNSIPPHFPPLLPEMWWNSKRWLETRIWLEVLKNRRILRFIDTKWDLMKLGYGGERGIRTLGAQKSTTVFETAPFDHSGTSPIETIARKSS